MSQRQAAWTSVGEYMQRREAHDKQQQLEWERSRWMAFSIFSPFMGKKGPKSPAQWVRFPWEQKRKASVVYVDESQVHKLNNILNKFKSLK